jgi:hypothetical protein
VFWVTQGVIGSPYVDKGKLRSLFKTHCEKAGELLNLSRNQLRIMMGLLTGHSFRRKFI